MQEKKLTDVRRKNREIKDEAWIKDYLKNASHGVFATSVDGQPFINWNLFIYNEEENVIYFHTAGRGRTKDNIIQNPKICFSIAEIGNVVKAKKAVDFSMQYKSVVVFGTAKIIEDDEKLMKVMQGFIDKYVTDMKPFDYEPFTLEDAKKATAYELTIDGWSAKRNDDVGHY